jgi:hypothetical protein
VSDVAVTVAVYVTDSPTKVEGAEEATTVVDGVVPVEAEATDAVPIAAAMIAKSRIGRPIHFVIVFCPFIK